MHTDTNCLSVYCELVVCADSKQLIMALQALGELHGLSGLRVWRLFAGRTEPHERHPAQYTAGRLPVLHCGLGLGTEQ